MDSCWNRDYRKCIIDFLQPVMGPISTEYLSNADGSVAIEELDGNPNYISFIDRGRVARYDFNLYVRTNGRDTASRKKAIDLFFRASAKCITEVPFPEAYIEMNSFPMLFNRNMSGNEEYRAGFSLFFHMQPDPIPLDYDNDAEVLG